MNATWVLAMLGSKRENSNSGHLLNAFCEGIDPGNVERVTLPTDILPCLGCDFCVSGRCIQNDVMNDMYGRIKRADLIVLAAPVYFYGFPSHVKAMIDRCQLFYNLKYKRKESRDKPGKGVVLSPAASFGKNLFSGISATANYWFDALDIQFAGTVFVRGVEGEGDILHHPKALDEARVLGRKLGGL